MRVVSAAVLSALLTTASLAQTAPPLCVLDPTAMPEGWRPVGEAQSRLSSMVPWSAAEASDALYAIRTGLDEMLALYALTPAAVPELWEDAVGSLIEVTYSSANAPEIDAAARKGAVGNLSALIHPYLDRSPDSVTCDDFELTLPLAIYAHKFYALDDPRVATMTGLTNAAYDDCASFDDAIGYEFPEVLADNSVPVDDVFDLVIWSLLFIEADLYPDIALPAVADAFSPALWRYLETYPLADAAAFEDGAEADEFIEVAYLATHIAYIPTGNHRHPIYIEDSPDLYRFHRENFYPVLEMGELDLVAEFVDSLRQYGCTEGNDLQVRDGTRFLLQVFHDGGDRWMSYREPGETDADVDSYDLIHKAWTGVLGVRPRNLEPSDPGTYGGVVRGWLPRP